MNIEIALHNELSRKKLNPIYQMISEQRCFENSEFCKDCMGSVFGGF